MSITEHRTGISTELAIRLYRSLCRIRRVEEEIAKVYPSDRIKSPVHLSIGQEAVSAAVCEALRPGDVVFGTYRSHALYLAKGGGLSAMIAELYGKVTGCARGKGGSMHLVDVAHGVMGTSAVVGTTIPNAVGYAYALKYRREDAIVVSFFGDGAIEEGVFSESLNFAALKKLPILFVCENNGYAIHSPIAARQAVGILEKICGHGVRARRVGYEVVALYEVAREVIASVRAGAGPAFLECQTYRWREHVGPNEDINLGYRDRHELNFWVERDQLKQIALLIDGAARQQIDAEIECEIRAAFAFAESSPFPAAPDLYRHTYKQD